MQLMMPVTNGKQKKTSYERRAKTISNSGHPGGNCYNGAVK